MALWSSWTWAKNHGGGGGGGGVFLNKKIKKKNFFLKNFGESQKWRFVLHELYISACVCGVAHVAYLHVG
jgi:hypothetical protein